MFAAACVLGGCSSSGGSQPTELIDIAQARPVRVLWTAQIGHADEYLFFPILRDGSVYAAGRAGKVVRFDAATGREIWRVAIGRPLATGVGSDGKLVLVASEKGEIFALDARDGTQRWSARTTSEVLAPPVPAGDMVLVRSGDSRVFAFGAADGKRRWVYQHPATSLMVRAPLGTATDADTAYVGFPTGRLVALSLATGNPRWEATVANPRGATELERVTDVLGEPAVLGREVCVAAYQGRVACYDTQAGNQLWVRDLASASGVSLDARYALVVDDRGSVHALDRSSGRSIWKQDQLGYRSPSLPTPAGNIVVTGDYDGYVHFLDRDTGAFIARFSSPYGAIRVAPLPLPSGVLVQTAGGVLYALAL
ncbi:MAG: outer membrane protein assembly factor BamB [Betaproteobacteria bacterium]|nr:outer membrane protein assembly factor BamB [Betaproteobacteria bacterium]